MELAEHAANADDTAEFLLHAGERLRVSRAYDQATACLSKAVESCPTSALIHVSLGWALYEAGRYEEALTATQRSLELDDKLTPQALIGMLHAIEPDNKLMLRVRIALLHVLRRDLPKALESYDTAFRLSQAKARHLREIDLLQDHLDIPETHYALGFCYEKKGKKMKAREHYQKYVDAAKEGKFVELAKERLRELVPE